MKSNRAAQSSVDISNLSVPDAEEIIEEALSELRFFPGSWAGTRTAFSGASRISGDRRAMQRKRAQQAPECVRPRAGRLKRMRFESTSNASTTALPQQGKVGHRELRSK